MERSLPYRNLREKLTTGNVSGAFEMGGTRGNLDDRLPKQDNGSDGAYITAAWGHFPTALEALLVNNNIREEAGPEAVS